MKKVLIGLAVVLVVFGAIGALIPNDYDVSRSVVVRAAPEQVHPLVNDLARWPEWMPWWETDNSIKTTLGAIHQGKGGTQSWESKEGRADLEIKESNPTTGIDYVMRMEMGKDMVPSNGTISYEPGDEGTLKVTWRLIGKMEVPILGGYFALAADRMMGPQFEKGLNKLKATVEAKK